MRDFAQDLEVVGRYRDPRVPQVGENYSYCLPLDNLEVNPFTVIDNNMSV